MKKKNIASRFAAMCIAALMAVSVSACSVDINQVGIPEAATVPKGETYQVEINYGTSDSADAAAIAKAAESVKLTWTSSDETIATVDDTGLVTAIAGGEADITATIEQAGISDTCHITVVVPAEGLTAVDALEMAPGDTGAVDAVMTPEDATGVQIAYSSSDDAVATVDETGTVTAVAAGECVITSTIVSNATPETATDEAANVDTEMLVVPDGMSAETRVTVTAPEPAPARTITLAGKSSVVAGKGTQYTAQANGADVDGTTLTWASSDASVAIVTNGWIDTRKAGTVTITATGADGATASAQLTVTAPVAAAKPSTTSTSNNGNSSVSAAPSNTTTTTQTAPAPAPAPVQESTPTYTEPEPAPAPAETQPEPAPDMSHGEKVELDHELGINEIMPGDGTGDDSHDW